MIEKTNKLLDIYDIILGKQKRVRAAFESLDDFMHDVLEPIEVYIVSEVFGWTFTDSESELFFDYYCGDISRTELIDSLIVMKLQQNTGESYEGIGNQEVNERFG